jgi:type IX secretion system substrate protein/beta-propeller repeat-containing protein
MKKMILFTLLFYTILLVKPQIPTLEWAKSMGGPDHDGGSSVKTDALGNVYTAGSFSGSVDFDPGYGTKYLHSKGYTNLFIQKLDASGNFLWAKSIGETGSVGGQLVKIDLAGNLYITGGFHNTVDFDPNSGIKNLTSNGASDIFVLKLDVSGNFLWAKSFGGAKDDYDECSNIDAKGNIYITGRYKSTVDFDPGPGITNLTSNGDHDIFVQKLDASGNFLWAKSIGGTGSDYSYSITVDIVGNAYTTGFFKSTIDFDPGLGVSNLTSNGAQDIFIQKLDASGNFVWAKSMGGPGYDYGHSITLDSKGNLYTTGSFVKTVDFDPGPGITNLTSNGGDDIFIQKLDASGNFLWAKSIEGQGYGGGSIIITDSKNNLYITGVFKLTMDFDPGIGIKNLTSNGMIDFFVLKLDDSGNYQWAISMGGQVNDYCRAIAIDQMGHVFISGQFLSKPIDFDPGPGVASFVSNGKGDIFIIKLKESTVGINDPYPLKGFFLYPNPSSGTFHLKIEKPDYIGDITLEIYNLLGKKVMERTTSFNQVYKTQFRLSKFVSGQYILCVKLGKGIFIRKLVLLK